MPWWKKDGDHWIPVMWRSHRPTKISYSNQNLLPSPKGKTRQTKRRIKAHSSSSFEMSNSVSLANLTLADSHCLPTPRLNWTVSSRSAIRPDFDGPYDAKRWLRNKNPPSRDAFLQPLLPIFGGSNIGTFLGKPHAKPSAQWHFSGFFASVNVTRARLARHLFTSETIGLHYRNTSKPLPKKIKQKPEKNMKNMIKTCW